MHMQVVTCPDYVHACACACTHMHVGVCLRMCVCMGMHVRIHMCICAPLRISHDQLVWRHVAGRCGAAGAALLLPHRCTHLYMPMYMGMYMFGRRLSCHTRAHDRARAQVCRWGGAAPPGRHPRMGQWRP